MAAGEQGGEEGAAGVAGPGHQVLCSGTSPDHLTLASPVLTKSG